jgi:hypothetical protein
MRYQCVFTKGNEGFYLLPLLGFSNTPDRGRCFWFGIGPWLWMWSRDRQPETLTDY